MRWSIEVTSPRPTPAPDGAAPPSETLVIEAKSWQTALQAARAQDPSAGPISQLSIELLPDGYRATDPSTKTRYLIRKTAADTPLTSPPSQPEPAPQAPPVPEPKPEPTPEPQAQPEPAPEPKLEPQPKSEPKPQVAESPSEPSPPLPPEPPPGPVPSTPASSAIPSTEPAAVPAPDAPAPAPAVPGEEDPGGGLPRYRVLMAREEQPSAKSPLTYREVVYAVAPGTPEEDAEMLLRKLWNDMAQQLWSAPPGKFLNLAVFDVTFTGRPPKPPLVTLTWKDWRGPTPEIAFPLRQRASQRPPAIGTIPPQQVAIPAAAPLPSLPPEPLPPSITTPPSGPPTEIPPTVPSSPECAKVVVPPPDPPSVEVEVEETSPPQPPSPSRAEGGGADLAARVEAPAQAEAPAGVEAPADPEAKTEREQGPPPPQPPPPAPDSEKETRRSESPTAEPPPAVTEEAKPAETPPPTATEEARPAEVQPPAVTEEAKSAEVQPPAVTEEAKSAEALPPEATEEAKPAEAPPPASTEEAKSAEAPPPVVTEEAKPEVPQEAAAEAPPSPRPPQKSGEVVTADPFAASSPREEEGPPKDARGKVVKRKKRLSGDDLLSDLFEAMHDVHFQPGVLEGAHYVLWLAVEKIPCKVAICHLFDINRREFVITHVLGDCRKDLLLRRASEKEPLIHQVTRRRRAVVLAGGDERLSGERWKWLGQPVVSAVVAPVVLGGRFLGLLELVNPVDREPFSEGDGYALAYIGEQFAEFLGQRGLMLDPEAIANFRPPKL